MQTGFLAIAKYPIGTRVVNKTEFAGCSFADDSCNPNFEIFLSPLESFVFGEISYLIFFMQFQGAYSVSSPGWWWTPPRMVEMNNYKEPFIIPDTAVINHQLSIVF